VVFYFAGKSATESVRGIMPDEKPNDAARAGGQWFNPTDWKVVMAAGSNDPCHGSAALEQICQTYWYPLYAYVRRRGYSPEDAQDLTQEFFRRFLESNSVSHARQERGRFRSFLLTSMQNFLADQWERGQAKKRGGGKKILAWDDLSPELRYKAEAQPGVAPERVYDERWAATVFEEALNRLRTRFVASGKSRQFEELKSFMSREPADGEYESIAARLGTTADAVAVAVHRLRKRYGELVREEIASTVSNPADIEDEMRHLLSLIAG